MKKCSYCGRVSDDALTICSQCGTALSNEHFEPEPPRPLTPSEVRAHRKAIRDGLLWIILSVGVLAIGWIYPAWFLGRDAITQRDTDLRLMNARGEAFLFCLLVSFVFALLAVRSFHHGRGSKSSSA